ncbi:MAG: hypothetical protein ACRDUY_08130 [Nitriliruptorales bacterium]
MPVDHIQPLRLRLGQLVANAAYEVSRDHDPFYVEDEELVSSIESLVFGQEVPR